MVHFAKVRPSFHFIEDSVPTKRSSDHKAKKMFSLAKKYLQQKIAGGVKEGFPGKVG